MFTTRGRLRIVATLAVALVAGCAPATARPRPSPSAAPTSPSATLRPLPTLVPVEAKSLTKVIYLTFDDGPSPVWTPAILSLLEEAGAHASFFVIGENAARWPLLVRQEAADSDTVGDHTWTHPDLKELSASAVYAELATDKSLIAELTGVTPTLWRPPYDDFNPSVVEIASRLGMKMQLWSNTTGDWQLPGTGVIVSLGHVRTPHRDGGAAPRRRRLHASGDGGGGCDPDP